MMRVDSDSKAQNQQTPTVTVTDTVNTKSIELTVETPTTIRTSIDIPEEAMTAMTAKKENYYMFLDLVIKSTIIVVIFCVQPVIIDIIWYIEFDGYLSVLIPMNMVSLNTVIDTFCVLLYYKFGEDVYQWICKCNKRVYNGRNCGCHYCCESCCKSVVKLNC